MNVTGSLERVQARGLVEPAGDVAALVKPLVRA